MIEKRVREWCKVEVDWKNKSKRCIKMADKECKEIKRREEREVDG